MTRTTIMLPETLKTEAQERAHELGLSMGELIRRSLRESLDRRPATREDDPLFREVPLFQGATPPDLAADPDRYLYEDDA